MSWVKQSVHTAVAWESANKDNRLMMDAAIALTQALHLERQAERAGTVNEWAKLQKDAVDAWADAFKLAVAAQTCQCGKDGVMCLGGAACHSIPIEGKCPSCDGPASVCKPRHAVGRSCG